MRAQLAQWKAWCVVFGLVVSAQRLAYADVDANFLKGMASADLAFRGKVVEVQYAMSTKKNDTTVALPHALVTYEVSSIASSDACESSATASLMSADVL